MSEQKGGRLVRDLYEWIAYQTDGDNESEAEVRAEEEVSLYGSCFETC
jgi:hypothetical protein